MKMFKISLNKLTPKTDVETKNLTKVETYLKKIVTVWMGYGWQSSQEKRSPWNTHWQWLPGTLLRRQSHIRPKGRFYWKSTDALTLRQYHRLIPSNKSHSWNFSITKQHSGKFTFHSFFHLRKIISQDNLKHAWFNVCSGSFLFELNYWKFWFPFITNICIEPFELQLKLHSRYLSEKELVMLTSLTAKSQNLCNFFLTLTRE